ncbi:MAG: zinc-ribbon domain-containing protein [Acidobacteriaceae bacterium]|nr:zinc-ribbon domain-containing protein [Acidobacteriaceae bacterium]MBV8569514.1 zinc-ribbon domain-containing protein [Acidobacteriaceae bacterium]
MTCPNCGLANAANARFCANCGTAFGAPTPSSPPSAGVPPPSTGGMSLGRSIGIGCLIVVLFIIFGLSCTRSCLFGRRHRYYVRHVSFRVAPVRPVPHIHH